ncbi:hypothetical protein [Kitasatospora sp. NPDC088134]|uniref:hypothetical protein n=1 Tax=Kitasatospora sp. NPDC088134 TaxID=3364071 RepID=UPI0038247425
METVFTSLVAVAGTLAGSLGAIHLQQRAARRATHRQDLRNTGGAFLAALTAYRAAVYALWTANTTTGNPPAEQTATVRAARAALTADTAVRTTAHAAVAATFALGDDQAQEQITTGRQAALDTHHNALNALATAIDHA